MTGRKRLVKYYLLSNLDRNLKIMKNNDFNLDNAIESWLKRARKYESFEDGQIGEIEDHIRSEISRLSISGYQEKEAFEKAVTSFGDFSSIEREYGKFRSGSTLFFLMPNFAKVAYRKFRGNLGLHGLNIFSFSVGLAVFLFISLFIRFENSFDRFNEKGDRIYRLEAEFLQGGKWVSSSSNSWYAGNVVRLNVPGVEKMVSISRNFANLSNGDIKFREKKVALVSDEFFDVFTAQFVAGNPSTAFKGPDDIVIDRKTAQKYFGDENPMGKTLRLDSHDRALNISAVIEPLPENTHFSFNVFMRIEGFRNSMNENFFTHPGWTICYNYMLLKEGEKIEDVEKQFPALVDNHFPNSNDNDLKLMARPLFDIHLKAKSGEELGQNRDERQVKILSYIGLAILLLSIFNFFNLSTARHNERIKEVGIRKVFGAEKPSIRFQFFLESLSYSLIAFLLAFCIVLAVLPIFTRYFDTIIPLNLGWEDFLLLFGFWILVAFLASIYPFLILSSVRISDALTKKIGVASTERLRKGLVFVQFTITISLLIGITVLYRQVNFLMNADPGYHTSKVAYFPKWGLNPEKLLIFEEDLKRIPTVSDVANCSLELPGTLQSSVSYRTDSIQEGPTNQMKAVRADDKFFQMMELELVVGKPFDENLGPGQVILNETAVKHLGWSEPLNKMFVPKGVDYIGKVVGVAKDFNFESLYNDIVPVVFLYEPHNSNMVYVRFEGDPSAVMSEIMEIAAPYFANPVEPKLIDDSIAAQYKADNVLVKLVGIFTLLSLLVAAAGIFGLALFMTQKRTKEIAIRKVIGANRQEIFWMLTRHFLILILIAALIAGPVSFYFSKQWLASYPYRIQLGINPVLVATFMTVFLTLIAAGFVVFRATKQNPSKILKYE